MASFWTSLCYSTKIFTFSLLGRDSRWCEYRKVTPFIQIEKCLRLAQASPRITAFDPIILAFTTNKNIQFISFSFPFSNNNILNLWSNIILAQ